MFVLYELDTGRAHSLSEEAITNTKPDVYGIKETALTGIWNTSTLDFEPAPVDKRMTTLEFMELFTDTEWVGVLDAAKVSSLVNLFVMKMTQAEFMDLNYQGTIDGISGLVSAGLLTADRANEVLNG